MPREIRFEPIPKTSTGKIQKFQLRERARSAAAIDQEQTMTETAAGESAPFVRRDRDSRGVVRLTLNRPQAFNALSSGMLDALQAELDARRRRRERARRRHRRRGQGVLAPATT